MAFAVFDIETRIDKYLLNRVFFGAQRISDQEAYERFRGDPRNRSGDFFPLTLHVPISIALGEVDNDYTLRAVASLALDNYSEESLVGEFWRRLEHFDGTLVSFNGRGFDLPVMELAAMRYGLTLLRYFDASTPASLRARHGGRHCDLYDFLCNYGATGLRGGMDLLLKMIGMPGKLAMDGTDVQGYFEEGRLEEIHRYCRSDVIQTYFLFIRVELMRGRIDEARYRAVYTTAAPFLAQLGDAANTHGEV
jgi:predicted PolB exonuclease-like 3'-5' exonuclease